MQNLSYENEFNLQDNEHVGGTYFDMNGFARRLILTQRQKATQKWPTANGQGLDKGVGRELVNNIQNDVNQLNN